MPKSKQEIIVEIKKLNPSLQNLDNMLKHQLQDLLTQERRFHIDRLKAQRDLSQKQHRDDILNEAFGPPQPPPLSHPAGTAYSLLVRTLEFFLKERRALYDLFSLIRTIQHLHSRYEAIRNALDHPLPDGVTVTPSDVDDAYYLLSEALLKLEPFPFDLSHIISPVQEALQANNLDIKISNS